MMARQFWVQRRIRAARALALRNGYSSSGVESGMFMASSCILCRQALVRLDRAPDGLIWGRFHCLGQLG